MQLVDEQDDRAFALGDFLEHAFQTFLEFAAEFRAGDQGAHVESEDAFAFQSFRHLAVDDALGQAFNDRRLADARLADQHRIVLGAALQYLDGAADFAVPADYGIEFPHPRAPGEIDAIAAQRLAAFLGFRIGHDFAAAQIVDGVFERMGADSARLEQFPHRSGIIHRRQQYGFAGDKTVSVFTGNGFRPIQQFRKLGRDRELAVVLFHARQILHDAVKPPAQFADVESGLGEQGAHRTALLIDQREQQVRGVDAVVAVRQRERLRIGERRLQFPGQFVWPHGLGILLKLVQRVYKCGLLLVNSSGVDADEVCHAAAGAVAAVGVETVGVAVGAMGSAGNGMMRRGEAV